MNLRLDFGGTSILMSGTRSRCCRVTSLQGITFTSVSLHMVLRKWMHDPMEKDEVYLHGYISRLHRLISYMAHRFNLIRLCYLNLCDGVNP